MRLGLSDSMRSVASVAMEDTEPLYTATHRRTPRPSADTPQTEQKPRATRAHTATRGILVAVLAAGLLVLTSRALGALLLGPGGKSLAHQQLERLESSFSMLKKDTEKLEASASNFLKNCQSVHFAASARTRMLTTSATSSFEEQVQEQVAAHERVMKDIMQYYSQQEQQIQEARRRLTEMNVTLPMQITVKAEQSGRGSEEQPSLNDASLDLLASVMTDSVETELETKRANSHGGYGPFLFYAFVACVSVGYLRNAIAGTRRSKLLQDNWTWTPVPTLSSRVKAFFTSVVVIEDLRASAGHTSDGYGPIEHIEC